MLNTMMENENTSFANIWTAVDMISGKELKH